MLKKCYVLNICDDMGNKCVFNMEVDKPSEQVIRGFIHCGYEITITEKWVEKPITENDRITEMMAKLRDSGENVMQSSISMHPNNIVGER